MAIIQVRALDNNGDPRRGAGLANFLTDLDAVAQIIATTLNLLTNEWFENLSLGTPLFTEILGKPTTLQAVCLVLRKRILSAPYVTGINGIQAIYGSAGRTLAFIASVTTQFGTVTLAGQPGWLTRDGISWSGLSSSQWASLTATQWANLTK